MAAENNLITQTDLAPAKSVYFVNKFNQGVQSLQELLGITNVIAIREGMLIKPLTSADVTLAGGDVAEGEIIPLSKVEVTEGTPIEVALKKYRKATSGEAIGKVGFDVAVNKTDEALLREVQRDVRTRLFTYLGTGTGSATGTNLQTALAQANGQVSIKFEDAVSESIALINPLDLADYLGNAQVTMQTAFGLTYLENFLGFNKVLVLSGVPQGTVYATAVDNLQLYKVDMDSSEIARAFNLRSDDLGLIGMTHFATHERLQYETLMVSGIYIVAERLDGVVKATITPSV